jgi:hypothetical protein
MASLRWPWPAPAETQKPRATACGGKSLVTAVDLDDQAAATLAPDKVAGQLTVDVQEMLQEIERLRAATAPLSR